MIGRVEPAYVTPGQKKQCDKDVGNNKKLFRQPAEKIFLHAIKILLNLKTMVNGLLTKGLLQPLF